MRIVRSPSGQGSSDHLVVADAQPVNRSSRDIPDKRAHHNKPSTTRETTLSGPKVLDLSLVSGNWLITLRPRPERSPTLHAPDEPPYNPNPRRHGGEDDIARLLAD